MYPKLSPRISVTRGDQFTPGVFSSPQSTARSHAGGRSGTGTLVPKGLDGVWTIPLLKRVDDHWGFSWIFMDIPWIFTGDFHWGFSIRYIKNHPE